MIDQPSLLLGALVMLTVVLAAIVGGGFVVGRIALLWGFRFESPRVSVQVRPAEKLGPVIVQEAQ